MKAVRVDVEIVTGAAWTRDVQLVTPGVPVAVETATPGSRYYIGELPLIVHSATDDGAGWTTLQLVDGTYGSPKARIPTGSLIAPAEPVLALEAAAAFAADPVPTPLDVASVEIPATISADGSTVTLALDADVTATMPVGAYSWDLYVRTAEHDWQRVVEGTLSVVDGDAR